MVLVLQAGTRMVAALCGVLLWGCASVSTQSTATPSASKTQPPAAFPPYSGPKARVQVVRFGIPNDIVQKYQELADKRVGWGLCNRIIEALWSTGRFEYIEEKEEILERMIEQWKLSQAGIYTSETAVEAGQLKAPEYLIYAEVFDFAVGKSEKVFATKKQEVLVTRIGIQIRMVDVKTGTYIPGSGQGEATTTQSGAIWAKNRAEFEQTTVGVASQQAVEAALRQLLERLEAK